MLTNLTVKSAKPKDKLYRLFDQRGLYLEVMPNGSKYWRLKYRFLGKEKRLAFGVYPEVSLSDAREKRDQARKLLADDIDPVAAKHEKRRQAVLNAANTFEAVAREWHSKQEERWTSNTGVKIIRYLENDIFPYLGSRPIADIDAPELLETLRKIEKRKAHYIAGRVRQVSGQVFRYAIATARAKQDPSAALKGALTVRKTQHYAALGIKDVPDSIRTLDKNEARLFPQTRRAIRLLILTFTRTTELIHAKWSEIDFENALYEIPKERMKMGNPHIVPLSRQAVALLKEQREETKHLNTEWVFPNQIRPRKPMSNNTVLMGIKRIGYAGRMTGHGFRSLAMTTLMEDLGYGHEIPDAQLAHAKGDGTRRAYDRTKYLPQRKKMMQEWSDYLERVAAKGVIIDFGQRNASA
jgi:integrase